MKRSKLKNITLSAPETLLNKARARALGLNTTLNALFREWLAEISKEPTTLDEVRELLSRLSYAEAGGKFTRDEMNER